MNVKTIKRKDKTSIQGITGTIVRKPVVLDNGVVILYVKSDADGKVYYIVAR